MQCRSRHLSGLAGWTPRFRGRLLFSYDQARGPVANLSGGERNRLQMALLMLSEVHFLMLDEPTNNLDIPSAEGLE
ncbi:MAG: ATP-binding cassette domain-containing protein, partial [Ardenticatenales bacterium]|nr:ATP-binding cassette domain-containing protein [Ardenticatenales bacterium]